MTTEARRAAERRRTDRIAGHRQAYEDAKKVVLATQDICYLCGKPVDKTIKDPYSPLHAEVDHVIPISKLPPGQEYLAYDISNLAVVHRCCNRKKGSALIEEKANHKLDEVISNRVLPQSMDWTSYKPSQG